MSENNPGQTYDPVTGLPVNQPAVQPAVETQTPAAAPAANPKKVRIGFIFLAIVPTVVLMTIQTIAQLPFMVLSIIKIYNEGMSIDITDTYGLAEYITRDFMMNYAEYAYIIYSVIGLIVFFIWYYKGFVKKNPKVKLGQIFGLRSILAVVGTVVGLVLFLNAAFVIVYQLAPKIIEDYNQLMEDAGIGVDTIMMIIYALLLGPILEELCYRGVTFGFLKKANVKPGIVIFISALLFGIMHMNLVQGVYATILGLLLGFLRYKYRSVILTITTHILFNIAGTFGEIGLEQMGITDNDGFTLILGGFALFVLVFVIVLVNNDKKAVNSSLEA
ncbi:MAG: CPBP family intramembrane metalloprotease [Clostridiales bacterium]|nr:CPBP family intramembrane metalloprotease [Clostridiales bacterium]